MSDRADRERCAHQTPHFELTCPSCGGQTSHVQRAHSCIDECKACGGVFFNRDELFHLIAEDAAMHRRPHERIEEAARLEFPTSLTSEMPYLAFVRDAESRG